MFYLCLIWDQLRLRRALTRNTIFQARVSGFRAPTEAPIIAITKPIAEPMTNDQATFAAWLASWRT
ncbi:MAG: hypothetical protein BRC44_09795 [Cyanobacteria bacterium QS_4_48_99]|nr:MAG: hypothetical protein BRC44_09795 [Cyanobacteria bacterium QS_4_48_99]